MKSTARSRRNRNAHTHEAQQQEQATPFFAKSEDRAAQKPFFSMPSGAVQTKLSIGQPGDKYEREADSLADRVVNQSAGQVPAVQQKPEISSIQRLATPKEDEKLGTNDARMAKDKEIQEKADPVAKEEMKKEEDMGAAGAVQKMDAPKEEEKPGAVQKMDAPKEEEKPGAVQKMDAPKEEEKPGAVQKMDAPKEEEKPGAVQKMDAPKEEEKAPVQAKSDAPATVSPALSGQIESSSGRGRQLPDKTRAQMEQGIGADFSGVNIHTDEKAADMNRELGAQAFTHGQDIYFNNGKYNPDTSSGKRLLAHELTHVVQQNYAEKKVNKLPGAALLSKSKSTKAINWYASNKKLYIADIINKIQAATGSPQTGVMDAVSVEAVANWQDTNGLAVDGMAGPNTLPALFPTGLADITNQTIFAVNILGIDFSTLVTAQSRAQAIMDAVNKRLTAAGVPQCGFALKNLGVAGGQLDFPTWNIDLNQTILNQASLSDADIDALSRDVYHEARHAEQWFKMAQMRAGEGALAATIQTEMSIPLNIAQQAVANPLAIGSMEALIAKGWYESVYGTKAAYRNNVLIAVLKDGNAYQTAQANAAAAPGNKVLQKKMSLAYDKFMKSYKKYRNLPEEHDAGRIGESAASIVSFLRMIQNLIL